LGNIVKRLSFVGISKATANFSQANKIGLGRMGTMYMATLPDGRFLAVKRIVDSQQFEEQIVSELKTLGTLKHKNLLPLFGFCVESNTRLLVYKYVSNGNLFDWIHSVKHRSKTLQWPLRLKIAVGVARGLARLHHGRRGQVVHLNISSKCILLDKNFEPKLSNFGKAMLIMSMSNSPGVHNEFCEMALVKEDVHGFGVVLLELITGMDCTRMNFSSNSILNEWIGHLLSTSPRDVKRLMISRSRCSLQFALLLLKTNLLAAETGPQLANLYFPVSIMFICCCFSIYKNLPFFRFISLVLPAWDTVLYTINKRKHFIIIKTS
jgi:interleukin-1 receptor-associated kinase 1